MDNYIITVAILCFLSRTVLTETDLQQQNTDHLSPLNDFENANYSAKDQDKRTIFGSGVSNYGWAKHVAYHPTGSKYVIGYSPVDLKYRPVIRPISIKPHGYYYTKPKLHYHVKRPVVHVGPPVWRPVVPLVKPVPVNVPPPPLISKPVHIETTHHVDHVHVQPVHHSDHVHLKPVHHVDHVHARPVHHVDHLHTVPLPHVDHVHTIPAHINHVHGIPAHHVDHIHTLPAPVPVNHVHPLHFQPVAVPAPQPVFQPSLFEVTKPNLGVLPFGTVFSSPILRNVPSPAVVPLPLKPALVPQPIAPVPVPLPQPAIIQPAPQPAFIHQPPLIHQQAFLPQAAPLPVPQPAPLPVAHPPVISQPAYPPGTFVEYHGTTNFINLAKDRVPVVPQTPAQPVLPPHYHIRYPHGPSHPIQPQAPELPHEQHDVQTPFIPSNNPGFSEQPLDFNSNQNNFMQQLPQDNPVHFQPADQVSTQHFYQQPVNQPEQVGDQGGGYVYQQPDIPNIQNAIQPGETDLQFPVHLPQHPGFPQSERQFADASQYSSNVFKPSIQLEPPYKK